MLSYFSIVILIITTLVGSYAIPNERNLLDVSTNEKKTKNAILSKANFNPQTIDYDNVTKKNLVHSKIQFDYNHQYKQTKHSQQKFNFSIKDENIVDALYRFAAVAKFSLDIHPSIKVKSSIHAVQQDLVQIFNRLSAKSNFVYHIEVLDTNENELENIAISIYPNMPYWQHYAVNYINLDRESINDVSLDMDIGSKTDFGNKSLVKTTTENKFWLHLHAALAQILNLELVNYSKVKLASKLKPSDINNTPKIKSDTNTTPNKLLILKESSTVTVYGTLNEHNKVKEYLNTINPIINKQVLIEVTIIEIFLDDQYQRGVDWSAINTDGSTITQNTTQNVIANPTLQLQLQSTGKWSIDGTLNYLQQFGTTKVLSNPRVMVINNQTALLKVVDNEVYFTTKVQLNETTTRYSTEINTIPVGLVMSVTPFITDNNQIILNVRPRVSRVTRYVNDPNPDLVNNTVISQIPVVQTREIESVIKLDNTLTVAIGGLMQETITDTTATVPGLSDIPYLGVLFKYDSKQVVKSELVILIQPTIL